jgi:hypothetical protein
VKAGRRKRQRSRRGKREKSNFTEGVGGEYVSDSEVDGSLGRWADEVSERCEIEALGVVLAVGRASTTSRVVELDIVVEVGEGEGELGDIHENPLGFVLCVIVWQSYCVRLSVVIPA